MLKASVGAAVAWTGARVSATGAGVSGARSLGIQYAIHIRGKRGEEVAEGENVGVVTLIQFPNSRSYRLFNLAIDTATATPQTTNG